jgi:hypothetical protein
MDYLWCCLQCWPQCWVRSALLPKTGCVEMRCWCIGCFSAISVYRMYTAAVDGWWRIRRAVKLLCCSACQQGLLLMPSAFDTQKQKGLPPL